MNSHDPLSDAGRLQEIAELGLLSVDVDPVLQEIVSRAAAQLAMPISLVGIVLDEALHVAASHGMDGLWLDETRGHPVEWAFCATSVRTREAYTVNDATTNLAHAANPVVLLDGVRCYAGVPLISSRGFVLGNLCVVGREERSFTEDDMAVLRGLGAEAMKRIEARRAER